MDGEVRRSIDELIHFPVHCPCIYTVTFGSPTCYHTTRQSPLQLLTIDFPPLHHCVRASLFRQGGHAILRGEILILLTKFHVRVDAPVMEGEVPALF